MVLRAALTCLALSVVGTLLADAVLPGGVVRAQESEEAAPGETEGATRLRELGASAPPTSLGQRALSCLGLGVFVLLGLALSRDRRAVSRRLVAWGLGLQLLFGLVVLKTAFGRVVFDGLNDAVTRLLGYTDEGSRFVFGPLMDEFSFALNVLPTILFFSALMTVLYHLGLMQRVVRGLARVLERTMGTSGSETLSAAANVFVGQTEAPLVVKPYLATMTRSELHAVMVGGFATVAGGVLAAYVGMLQERFPDIAGHLLAASVMSAPAALVMAKLMLPETEASPTAGGATLEVKSPYANVIDAAAQGAGEGLKLAANVAAMLLAFLALLALLNALLAAPVSAWNALAGAALEPVTLQDLLGWLFWPVAFVMGVAAEDCATVGMLLGEKIVLTEFVAYAHLAELLESGAPLQPRSLVIATYALCGFANFGSIAIQIGGIGALVPERRSELAELGLRAMVGGTLAACMTATVAGLLL